MEVVLLLLIVDAPNRLFHGRIESREEDDGDANAWQEEQIKLLDTGELAKRLYAVNNARGLGRGSNPPLSRQAAMQVEILTDI